MDETKINKKGLVARELILIIILVVSFVILLMVILFYPWSGTIDKEACHNSIVMRSTFNLGPFEPGKSLPLKCTTEKICVTMSGQDCAGMPASTKDNPVTKINVKTKGDVMQVLANAIYDCNAMLGEGNLDFEPHTFREKTYCLICSRIAFDDKVKQNIQSISYVEFYQAMEKLKIPDGRSYLEAVYGAKDANTMNGVLEVVKNKANEDVKLTTKIGDIKDLKIDLNQQGGYALVAQMKPKGTWTSWAKAGGVIVAAVGVILVPFTFGASLSLTTAGLILAAGTTTAVVVYSKDYPNENLEYVFPTIVSYNADVLSNLGCYSFETAP